MTSSPFSWTVTVADFFPGPGGRQCRAVALIEGVSIFRAKKLLRRHARRGVKLFGGDTLTFDSSWDAGPMNGARGGRDLTAYRAVFIRPVTKERRAPIRERRHG